ncbi:unnamed protein product [Bursaphelenchus xylophilus]|uniref:(pine wood nematode) hypothetical protein n=1 Tax=Bursaphelenchus xylophilus TaxID=6326 RepID=A0A1I7SAN8_BURXY|nr:unnamed protein product [Bursaphelenchus xylophilus]CAG9126938.1 unnamed protein product [Bursaphelenchus xylophilus]
MPIISVADYQLAHQTFVKHGDDFFDRISFGKLDDLTRGGAYGLLFTGGDLAREHRRFGLRVFREFGVGKSLIQEKILEETSILLSKIDTICGIPNIDLVPFTDIAVGSIINLLMFGYRYTEGGREEEFYKMKKQATDLERHALHPVIGLWIVFDFIHKVPFCKRPCETVVKCFREMLDDIQTKIEEHKVRLRSGSCTKAADYVDAYLMEREKREATGEDTSLYSDLQLQSICADFWSAGQVTTSATISWCIAFLIHNPKVQDTVGEELYRVIGRDRMVAMTDKNSLPYTNAVIAEVQRRTNLVAENLFRTASRDCEINGYQIKKGQVVLPQVSVLLEDPEVFQNPKVFRPERFIDQNGQYLRSDALLPFGVGKRSCLGEGLARTELFLFLANLMYRYRFLPGDDLPVLEKHENGGAFPITPYRCKVIRRTASAA